MMNEQKEGKCPITYLVWNIEKESLTHKHRTDTLIWIFTKIINKNVNRSRNQARLTLTLSSMLHISPSHSHTQTHSLSLFLSLSSDPNFCGGSLSTYSLLRLRFGSIFFSFFLSLIWSFPSSSCFFSSGWVGVFNFSFNYSYGYPTATASGSASTARTLFARWGLEEEHRLCLLPCISFDMQKGSFCHFLFVFTGKGGNPLFASFGILCFRVFRFVCFCK